MEHSHSNQRSNTTRSKALGTSVLVFALLSVLIHLGTFPAAAQPDASQTTAIELLDNGSLEDEGAHWDRLVAPGGTTNWVVYSADQANVMPPSGSRFGATNTTTPYQGSIYQDSAVGVDVDDLIIATAWVRSQDPEAATGKICIWGLGITPNENSCTPYSAGSDWQPVLVSYVPTGPHSQIRTEVYPDANTTFFDDVSTVLYPNASTRTTGEPEDQLSDKSKRKTTNTACGDGICTDHDPDLAGCGTENTISYPIEGYEGYELRRSDSCGTVWLRANLKPADRSQYLYLVAYNCEAASAECRANQVNLRLGDPGWSTMLSIDPPTWRICIDADLVGGPFDSCGQPFSIGDRVPGPTRRFKKPTGPVGPSEITDAGGGITVHKSVAGQVRSMISAAAADGLTLTGWGYRSNASQIRLRRAHCGTSNYAIYHMPSNQCSPPTARPGRSMHERGLAIDFKNCGTRSTPCYQWLARHAAHYGLHNLPSEPWHWSTNGR